MSDLGRRRRRRRKALNQGPQEVSRRSLPFLYDNASPLICLCPLKLQLLLLRTLSSSSSSLPLLPPPPPPAPPALQEQAAAHAEMSFKDALDKSAEHAQVLEGQLADAKELLEVPSHTPSPTHSSTNEATHSPANTPTPPRSQPPTCSLVPGPSLVARRVSRGSRMTSRHGTAAVTGRPHAWQHLCPGML